MKKITLLFITVFLFFNACKKDGVENTDDVKIGNAVAFSNNVSTEWMNLFRFVAQNETLNPPIASRFYAYAGITLYESVVKGASGFKSIANQLNGNLQLPKVNYLDIDYELASSEALYVIAKNVLNKTLLVSSNDTIEKLRLKILYDKRNSIESNLINNSIQYGRIIGNAVLNWSRSDYYDIIKNKFYGIPSRSVNPKFWAPTDNVNLNPIEPFWGEIRTFAIEHSTSCFVPSNIPFSTVVGSAFYNQAQEVVDVKANLTTEQEHIAMWWADVPGVTPSPSGHWINIATILSNQLHLNLVQSAEMYALVGIAAGDAFISCWEAKYRINLLRPKTYIRDYIAGQSNWEPKWATPPFPEYTSGHSVCSGAVATILTHLFGNISFTDNTNSYLGVPSRSFTSFNNAAAEAAISRLYGGIHYREAIELGIIQGNKVGNTIIDKIKTK
jgi:hypothetical protein